jgi:uncharacterized membrane protein
MRSFGDRRRDEQGIIAVVVSIITCFTLIPLAAFAVDIGVQRVARRDMQALADVVALDLAREIDGRTYSQLQGHLQTWADTSADRNSKFGTATVVAPELGIVDEANYDTTDADAVFTPVLSDADGIPNAVRVTASTTVDFSIHSGSGGAARSAIAMSSASACFRIGSFALHLNSEKSALLNALVGDALNLSAISYTGLANANISLGALSTELGVGTPDELVDLDDLSLNQLFQASAHVLASDGGEAADVALLNTLASANFSSLSHIALGDLFAIETGSGAALASSINLFDLVAASAFLANGTNALAVPSVTAGVPGVAGVTASLHVIQAPILKCGHVGASQPTSQITLDATFTLANTNILGLTASSKVFVHVDVAEATGTLTKIVCGMPEGIDVSVASSLSQLGASLATDLKLLGVAMVHVDGGVGTTAPGATNTVQIRIPPNAYDEPVSSGSGVVLPTMVLDDLHATVLAVLPLGVTVSGVLSGVLSSIVTPTVNPLITNFNNQITGPLSKLLGLELAGADVFAVQTPTCADVSMVG